MLSSVWSLILLLKLAVLVGAGRWSNTSDCCYADSTSLYPNLVIPINTDSVLLPATNTSVFKVFYDPTAASRGDTLVQFSVPNSSVSYGCQLQFDFPAGFSNLADCGGLDQLDVWVVDTTVGAVETWANAPSGAELFGIALLSDGVERVLVNSCDCEPVLSFRVCIASTVSAANVSFIQSLQEGLIITRSY